jgi:hypothetical protein
VNANESRPQPTSLGEWRERHLCLRCGHHAVCKMASALDPNFLVVISQCLAFEPAEPAAEEQR